MTTPLARAALGALLGAALLSVALLCGALLCGAPAAHAIEIGEVAPEIEVNDVFHADEDFSLKGLRGRLILFELFSTG